MRDVFIELVGWNPSELVGLAGLTTPTKMATLVSPPDVRRVATNAPPVGAVALYRHAVKEKPARAISLDPRDPERPRAGGHRSANLFAVNLFRIDHLHRPDWQKKTFTGVGRFPTSARQTESSGSDNNQQTKEKYNSMKKIAFSFIAGLAVASSALAGHEVKESKEYKTPIEPCFKDQEFQIDLFGSYTDATSRSQYGDGFGGGIALNYFFLRYLGIGVDGNLRDSDASEVWNVTGSLIARYPIEAGGVCLAPYVLAGGGYQVDGSGDGTWHAGGGLEWRAVPQKLGIFAEGRYTWAGDDDDNSAQVRAGVRFVF